MNMKQRNGLFTLLAIVGGVWAYRNRASIQRYLESRGIDTPLDRSGNFVDTVKSAVAQLTGRAEHSINNSASDLKKTG